MSMPGKFRDKSHTAWLDTARQGAEVECFLNGRPFGEGNLWFVANHAFDCVGAKAYGMRTCYVDRRKRPFGQWPYQLDLIVADFKELAERIA